MLRVLHGPFHPELEEAFLAEFRAVKEGEPLAPVVVVTPSQRLARHLAARAAEAFPAGLAAVRFHNLFSFARAVDEERPEARFRLIDNDLLLERLIVAIIERRFGDRPYLKRALAVPGTARAILGAVNQLREGAVDPADALNAMREGHLSGGEDSVKLAELLSLHHFYAKELRDRGWRDRADVVARAAELAPRSKLLAAQKAIFYYGFYELVQAQLDLFQAAAGAFPVTAFYPYRERPEYAFCRDFFTHVLGGEKRPLPTALTPGAARRRVLSASGPRDEVWAAAKEILRLRDRGVPFEEIGVVARTLEPYAEPIESVFRENRIPFVSNARLPEAPDRELRLLSVADARFPRDLVVSLLELPDVRTGDLVTRRLGIGRGREEWERRLFPWEGRDFVQVEGERSEPREFRVTAGRMTALVGAVRDLFARTSGPERGTWAEHAAWARGLIGPRPEIDSLARLDDVAPPPTGAEFRRLLREELRRATRPVGADNVRGVQVLDAMAARGLGFRAVILLGLNERVWPRFILEDPFIPDAVRNQIKFRLGSLLPEKLAGYDEERLLFEMAAGSAREDLLILWQRSDDRGRVQVRSPFIEAGRAVVSRRPALRLAESPLESLTPKEAAVRAMLAAPRAEGRGEAVARAFGWDADALSASVRFLRAIEDDRKCGPRDGAVGALDGYWTALKKRGLSPTSLETFSQCGFLYFAQKVLGLEPLKEPESQLEFDPMETGSLYHAFLDRYYRSKGDFDRCLAETVREFEERRTMRYPLLWEAERARMRAVLEAFVAHDAAKADGFVPSFFEERVAGTLDLPLGRHDGMRFMGYFDRMDVHPSGAFRVIDYKRAGATRYRWTMEKGVLKGHYLQPPIYFLLGERFLRERGVRPDVDASSAGYFFLEELADGEPRHDLWLRGDFWVHRDRLAQVLQLHLDAIADGRFILREDSHCKWCDFSPVCRRRHQPTRWRARRAAPIVPEEDGA